MENSNTGLEAELPLKESDSLINFNVQIIETVMKHLILPLLLSLTFCIYGQTGIDVPGMSQCDAQMQTFLNTYNIPGATMALAKDGKLVYSRAFGNANLAGTEVTRPYHMMRIASVSKPLTAIGIMKMADEGLLNLSDKVFGEGSLLENHWYFSQANITDSRYNDITVQMLLEHTAGWDRSVNCFPDPTSPYPWFFSGCDPIVAPLHVTLELGETNPAKEEHLIAYLLEKDLNHDPGSTYAYSNMGYLLLSEIIEEISGMSYEAWMQQEILHPLGIFDMHIGKNLLVDKREREAEYQGNGFNNLSVYGDGTTVPWEYGGFSVEIMDGHGGWIATARDLVRVLVAVDGFSTNPDILSADAITTMTTPSEAASFYAKGWSVNASDNWWHTGAIDGTASIYVRTNGGYTWAIILNKRVVGGNANVFWSALDLLGWNCINNTTNWPEHDLFEAPTIAATALRAEPDSENGLRLTWENGNGTARMLVAKQADGAPANQGYFDSFPVDGIDYTENSTFGGGDDLGDGSFVVYNGTGNSAVVNGLSENTEYVFRVYEYIKNAINGNNALYLLGNSPELHTSTAGVGINKHELDQFIHLFPNPAGDKVILQNKGDKKLLQATITDVSGRMMLKVDLTGMGEEKIIELSDLLQGIYFVRIESESGSTIRQLIKQ